MMLSTFKYLCAVLLLCKLANAARGYYGAHLGKLTQLHHGVSGDVYAVDSRTLFLKNFNYDGEGPAAYFYVGNTKKIQNQGAFRLRDERGSTGVIKRYRNKDITLSLPEGKTLRDIKWFSVWCDEFSVNFGDVKIPRDFDFPRPHKVGALRGVHGVTSDNIVIVDTQTILIPNFTYDGEAPDAKFWVGRGQKPTANGIRIPDENGRETPLRKYDQKTIVLTLPGDLTVFDIGHFGIWCEAFTVDFGHVTIPQNPKVPPSLKMLGISPQSKLNCEVLYDDLAFEVRWAVAGESIVIQLVAKLEDGEYMSFGLSPDRQKTFMVGADVAVAWIDKETGKGYAEDYYLDAKSQCSGNRGSCPDARFADKTNSIRVLNAAMVNGYSIVTYQRPLRATDKFDLPIVANQSQAVAWAIGPLNQRLEVSYHSLYARQTKLIQFGREPLWNCPLSESEMKMMNDEEDEQELYAPPNRYQENSRPAQHQQQQQQQFHQQSFSDVQDADRRGSQSVPARVPQTPRNKYWEIPPIECHEPEDGVFYAQMGPTGGKQGYPAITGHVGWGISWYINGLLIPEINVVRGKTYTFVVEGGHDPDIPAQYHPFYITDDSVGGYEHKTEEEKSNVRIFAGVTRSRNGDLIPTGTGRLCNWTPDPNGPPADEYSSFGAYQRSLTLKCEQGEPGVITWRPDQDTPDTVYYQCFTHRYLGWKINVHDGCDQASQGSQIDEVYVQPDAPESLLPQESIRHETKVAPNGIHLLQNEFNVQQTHDQNNAQHRNSIDEKVMSPEVTKMIADGILAAEALEQSMRNKSQHIHDDAVPLLNGNGEPVHTSNIEPLPIFLTPPRSSAPPPHRPYRFENSRIPLKENHLSSSSVIPLKQQNLRYKNPHPPNVRINYDEDLPPHGPEKVPTYVPERVHVEPIRKVVHEYRKVAKLPPPSMRRDYAPNLKVLPVAPYPSPQSNAMPISLHKQILRTGPSGPYKKPFIVSPFKSNKKPFQPSPQHGFGFKPDSVIIESGFTPIMRRRNDDETTETDSSAHDTAVDSEYDEYVDNQKQRRNDRIDETETEHTASPELLIKTFEPMFIPSPPDSTNATRIASGQKKRLVDDLQYMEVEDGEDKMAMADGSHAFYLPPETNHRVKGKSTKLFPAGTVVSFDGKEVHDTSLVNPGPTAHKPRRIDGNIMASISSTEQLMHLPQYVPFKGEIPPLTPELMRPQTTARSQKSRSET